MRAKFETEADPNGELSPEERGRRADNLQQAHYLRMAAARSKKAKARKAS